MYKRRGALMEVKRRNMLGVTGRPVLQVEGNRVVEQYLI